MALGADSIRPRPRQRQHVPTRRRATRGLNSVYKPVITDVEAPSIQQGMSDVTMTRFKAREVTLALRYD